MSAKKQTAKSITAPRLDGETQRNGSSGGGATGRGARNSTGVRLAILKKFSFECIFLLHAKMSLVFCECELASPEPRE
jgi:hypothetical protein